VGGTPCARLRRRVWLGCAAIPQREQRDGGGGSRSGLCGSSRWSCLEDTQGSCMVTKLWFAGLYEPCKPLRAGVSGTIQKNGDGWGVFRTMDVLMPSVEGSRSSSVHLQRNPVRLMNSWKVCISPFGTMTGWMVSSLNSKSCRWYFEHRDVCFIPARTTSSPHSSVSSINADLY